MILTVTFQVLFQLLLKDQSLFMEVPGLSSKDIGGIIQTWLTLNHRCLQSHQLDVVTSTFNHCPLPLFLKLSFDEACRWSSFTPIESTVIEKSIRDIISTLFTRIERSHGQLLVSHALAYITLSMYWKKNILQLDCEGFISLYEISRLEHCSTVAH